MHRMSRTFWELTVNCVVLGILIEMICIFLPFSLLKLSVGLWIGVGVAVAMAASMEASILRGMEMGENGAVRHIRIQSILRYAFIVAGFGLILVYDIGNPLTCFAGIMTLKVAAYLQPFTHKILSKKDLEKED